MGSRMEALVGELTKKAASKANKAMASKELTKLRSLVSSLDAIALLAFDAAFFVNSPTRASIREPMALRSGLSA